MNARCAVALAVAVGLTSARATAQTCEQQAPGYAYTCGGWNGVTGGCCTTSLPACFPEVTPSLSGGSDVVGQCCFEGDGICDEYAEATPTNHTWICCEAQSVCASHCGIHTCWDPAHLGQPCDPEPPCDPCNEFGDPISGSSGASSASSLDVKIPGTLGGIEFKRHWSSSALEWKNDSPLHVAPKPFGGYGAGSSGTQQDLPEWTHNALAVVGIMNVSGATRWSVRKPGGMLRVYAPCAGTPCWASPLTGNFATQDRLKRTPAGFELWQPNGERLVFEARYVSAYGLLMDGGAVPTLNEDRYFLSRLVNRGGVTTLTATYQRPAGLTCPQEGADAGTGAGVPYLYQLTSPEAAVRFGYVALSSFAPDGGSVTDAGVQCVIRSVYAVNMADAGIASTLATYTYVNDGVERPGRIISATLADRTETYAYSPNFTKAVGGTTLSTHGYSSGKVTSDVTLSESLSVSWGTGSCATGSNCCSETPVAATVTNASARSGVGDGGAAGLTTVYLSLANNGQQHQPRRYQTTDSCTVAGACSPGSSRSEWVCSTSTVPGYEQAVKNKRDNWEAYTWAAVDAGFSFPVLEKRGVARGAEDKYGSNALETETHAYVYGNGQQLPSTTTRPSVYLSGNETMEKRWYDTNNRLTKLTRRGYAPGDFSNPEPAEKIIATFYFTSRSCGGTASDALGRTLETHGPCFVDDDAASDCSGTYPVTVHEYWPLTDTANRRANRLKAVRRYVNGNSDCAGTPLSTLYDDYDFLGNAGTVTDEAGNATTYTFDASSRMLSRTKGGHTTSFAYDSDKLSRVIYPASNAELFCYRTGTNAGCTTGSWTPQLQWKAKMACTASSSGCSTTSPSSEWSELVAYTYAPDGTVSREEYRSCASGACTGPAAGELRRVMKYNADAHRRPTWRQVGDATGQYAATSFFDRADNLAGVGLPFNATPAFCGGPESGAPDAPDSKLCAALNYDRAERLASFTEYPTGNSGSPQSTCFGYDAHGNVNVVTPGCDSSCDQDGTCDEDWQAAIEYTWDDFGNLVTVQAPWTSGSGSAGKAPAHYFHDARGNVVYELNPVQSESAASDDFIATSWDMLDRPTLKQVSEVGGTLYTLWELAYGQTASPTNCPSLSNTGGRLSSRVDAYGSTFYSYDVEGRVTKEVRVRAPDTQCTGTGGKHPRVSPHTFYTYDANGNLTAIEYPHGRTVTYLYGTGGHRDRVASVEVMRRESSSWSTKPALDTVQWEPYGGLRGYRVRGSQLAFEEGADFTVEYLQGDNASVAPTSVCPSTRPSTGSSDVTGRMRALFVSRFDGGSGGAGDIYRRWYTYQADVPKRIESCLLNETSSRVVEYGYDKTLRLTSVDGGYPKGPSGVLSFSYNAWGDRTASTASGQSSQLSTTNSVPRAGRLSHSLRSDGLRRNYAWDSAGRPSPTSAVSFLPNGAGARSYEFDYFHGAGITFHAFGVDGLWYNYSYDAFNRRVTKQYPSGWTDDYFYDLGHQMLAEEGFGDETRIVYDYVWLGGRPVLVARGALIDGAWQPDSYENCGRLMANDVDTVPCGFFAVVTDALGAPTLMVDSAAYPTGANDSARSVTPIAGSCRVRLRSPTRTTRTTSSSAATSCRRRLVRRCRTSRWRRACEFPCERCCGLMSSTWIAATALRGWRR